MLTKLELHSFKCFPSVSLEFTPITVLIGPNGTGKSTVLQALSLLKQSRSQRELIPNGPYVNLVGLRDCLLDRKSKAQGRIRVEYVVEAALGPLSTGKTNSETLGASYELTFDQNGPVQHEARFTSPSVTLTAIGKFGARGGGEVVPDRIGEAQFRIGNLVAVPLYVRAPNAPDAYQAARSIRDSVATALERTHIVPLRRGLDEADYPLSPTTTEDFVTPSSVANFFAYNTEERTRLSGWLQRLLEDEDIELRFELLQELKVSIEVARGAKTVNLAHEGAGVRHALWPLAQIVAADSGSPVGIEEPEIHLHPRAQAELIELFVHAALEENKQLILTTHSEHILQRLLTLVAKGVLSQDDLTIYSFSQDESRRAVATNLKITQHGQVEGGLAGFLETDVDELDQYFRALSTGLGE